MDEPQKETSLHFGERKTDEIMDPEVLGIATLMFQQGSNTEEIMEELGEIGVQRTQAIRIIADAKKMAKQ